MIDETIFHEALSITSPEGRASYLDSACGNDLELRRSVEELLKSFEKAGDFLDRRFWDQEI